MRKLLVLMVSLVCGLGFSSCEKGFDTSKGAKLTKVIDEDGDAVYSAKYDNDGKIIELGDYWDVWIRKTDTEYYNSDSESTALLNSDGLLGELRYDRLTYTFEYDSNGRIIGIIITADSGEWMTYSFIWENDNIVRISDIYNDGYSETAKISYGEMKNTNRLWPMGFAECCNIDDEYLAFLMSGLMGECSANLPSSVSYSCRDYKENYTISYKLNGSKAIEEEIIGSDDDGIYNYVYNN